VGPPGSLCGPHGPLLNPGASGSGVAEAATAGSAPGADGARGTQGPSWLSPGRAFVTGTAALLSCSVVCFTTTSLDDAFITFWPASTLARYGQLLNYNGDRVEQSSSLLHTILLAALSGPGGLKLPAAAWLLSVACSVGLLALSIRLGERLLPYGAGRFLPLLLGTSPLLAYWTVNTLETTLAALVIAAHVLATVRFLDGESSALPPALTGLAVALARPEGVLIWLAANLAFAVVSSAMRSRRPAGLGLFLLSPAVALAGLTSFRWIYFGSLAAEPVYSKIGGALGARIVSGLSYLSNLAAPFSAATWCLWALFGVGVLRAVRSARADRMRSGGLPYAFLYCLAGVGFIVTSGGDWLEAGRFLVPFLALILIGVLSGAAVLGRFRIGPGPVAFVLVALNLASLLHFVTTRTTRGHFLLAGSREKDAALRLVPEARQFSWVERTSRSHLRDVPMVTDLDKVVQRLEPALGKGEKIRIASRQAGMVIFHLAKRHPGALEFVDLCGLSTRHLRYGIPPAVLASVRSPNNFGACVPYETYFAASVEPGSTLPRPDIVFDLDSAAGKVTDVVRENGYVVTFAEHVYMRGFGIEADYGPVDQFVAVRRELAEKLGLRAHGVDFARETRW
jgi:hypothetical protein